MKTRRVRISIDSDMQAFQFFENLSHASAFKKHNEIKKLIEAGFHALNSKNQLQQVVNSAPLEHSPIEHPLKIDQMKPESTNQMDQTQSEVATISEAIDAGSKATDTNRKKLLSLMSSAVKK